MQCDVPATFNLFAARLRFDAKTNVAIASLWGKNWPIILAPLSFTIRFDPKEEIDPDERM